MTSRKMRRKKKAPDAKYTIAVVKLMETLLRSPISETKCNVKIFAVANYRPCHASPGRAALC